MNLSRFLLEIEQLQNLDRTFGVEFEMCFESQQFIKWIEQIAPSLQIQLENYRTQIWNDVTSQYDYDINYELVLRKIITNNQIPGIIGYKVHHDSSIKPNKNNDLALEIVTPILRGKEGLKSVYNFCKWAQSVGGYVNESCGGHVHIGAKDLIDGPKKAVANKIILGLLMGQKFTPLLNALVPVSRRGSEFASPNEQPDLNVNQTKANKFVNGRASLNDIDDYELEELIELVQQDRYRAINFQSLPVHGTIEFRIFEGSLDPRKVIERILFGTSFVNKLKQVEVDVIPKLMDLKDQMASLSKGGKKNDTQQNLAKSLIRLNRREHGITLQYFQNQYLNQIRLHSSSKLTVSLLASMVKLFMSCPDYAKPQSLVGKTRTIKFKKPLEDQTKRFLVDMSYDTNFIKSFDDNQVVLNLLKDTASYQESLKEILHTYQYDAKATQQVPGPEQFIQSVTPKQANKYKKAMEMA